MDIKTLRKMAGLTQFELAQRCGVSRMRLSLAECGQLELRPDEEAGARNVLVGLIKNRAAQFTHVISETRAVAV